MILGSVVTVVCNNVVAQTLETIAAQRKIFENNPQIEVGSGPTALAVNPQTNKIYVVNSGDNTVSVIDSNTGNAAKKIRVGISPGPIAVDTSGNRIYVANEASGTVSVIDGYNDSEIAQIPVGASPKYILFDSNTVWVANDVSYSVSVINASNNRVEANIALGGEPVALAESGFHSFIGGGNFPKIYVANINDGIISVINALENRVEANISLGFEAGPVMMASDSRYGGSIFPKIYVANSYYNNISVINALNNTLVANITLGKMVPSYITFDPDYDKLYVTLSNNNIVSVISGSAKHSQVLNLQYHFLAPGYIDFDPENSHHIIYVANSGGNTVSKISAATGADLGKIVVGKGPGSIAHNGQTGMFYVVNGASNTISVINGFSSKVDAGVTFNVSPSNSGTIMCGSKEYPTNTYLYVDNGTSCTAQGKNNFEFDGWVQNLVGRNSSLPTDEPSGNLTVDRYGTFTANFKPLPPPIPPEYSFLIISVIITSMIGWSVPSIAGWYKSRKQLEHLEECIDQIGRLDKNAIDDKIKGYYVHGKISEDHRQFLKDKIAEYYDTEETR